MTTSSSSWSSGITSAPTISSSRPMRKHDRPANALPSLVRVRLRRTNESNAGIGTAATTTIKDRRDIVAHTVCAERGASR